MLIDAIKKPVRRLRRLRNDKALEAFVPGIDAFLISYPKSGRTWLRYLLSCYFAHAGKVDFEPDLRSTFRVLPNFDQDEERGLPAFVGKREGLPLIAVSHRPFDPRFFGGRPLIFKVRDPRDVCVSAYFHETRHKQRFDGDISAFIEDEQRGIPAIIAYHNGWAAQVAKGPSVVVSYEEMSEDTASAVTRILEFLGLDVDQAALASAIEKARFDQMKKNEKKTGIPGHEYDRSDDESLRVRKGKVGGYEEYLSDADVERVLQLCREGLSPEGRRLMAHTGLDL